VLQADGSLVASSTTPIDATAAYAAS
jgi:hypothetical protein